MENEYTRKEIVKLREKFDKMVSKAPRYDMYSYWPGDDTRKCVHAFQTNKKLKPYCINCGRTISGGSHIKDDNGKEYDYTI